MQTRVACLSRTPSLFCELLFLSVMELYQDWLLDCQKTETMALCFIHLFGEASLALLSARTKERKD